MDFFDKDYVKVSEGDIIDMHQTINGHSKFVVLSLNPLDIRYRYDTKRKYEYDQVSLLSPSFGLTEFEIIGNIDEKTCMSCGKSLDEYSEYYQREGYIKKQNK